MKKTYDQEKFKLWNIDKPGHDEFDLLFAATAIEKKLILITDNTNTFKIFKTSN